jgi:hypothetical protein
MATNTDEFGACPECGGNDGCLNVGRALLHLPHAQDSLVHRLQLVQRLARGRSAPSRFGTVGGRRAVTTE